MSFDWPIALVALLLLPLVVVAYVLHERRRNAYAERYANAALLPAVVDRAPGRLRHLPLVLFLLGLTAIVLGMARPHATVEVEREEATVVVAIDVSRSMKSKDIPPTRLGAAQRAAKKFVADVPEKFRVGVVSFATRAVVGVAPTDDRKLVEAAIDRLKPGEGTAVGDAVVLSARLGRTQSRDDGPPPPRAVLLISDGARDGGRLAPQEAARRARRMQVPVYTVLLGTPNGVVEETLVGGFRRQIRVPPSAETLRQISQISGGKALAATDVEGLERVHKDLASRLGTRKQDREVGDWFAGGAAAFLVAGGALSALWLRRVP